MEIKRRRKPVPTTDRHELVRSFAGIQKGFRLDKQVLQISEVKVAQKYFRSPKSCSFSNAELEEHFNGTEERYYSSIFDINHKKALWAIDNDLKAEKFAELNGDRSSLTAWEIELNRFIPGIQCFRSRGGIGSHGSFYVTPGPEYDHLNFEEKNLMARRLYPQLQKQLETYRKLSGYQFSKVEIKGTNACVDYKRREIKFGTLCWLPKEQAHYDYIAQSCPVMTFLKIENLIAELKELNGKLESEQPVILPMPKKKPVQETGSYQATSFDMNWALGTFLLNNVMHGEEVRSNDGRYKVSAEQAAVTLCIIKMLQDHDKKKFGTVQHMGFSRIKGMWLKLLEDGDIDIPYQDRVVTAVRNVMSEKGYIKWHSSKYAGNKACVFEISDEFFTHFAIVTQPEKEEECCCVVKELVLVGTQRHRLPVFDLMLNPFCLNRAILSEMEEEALRFIA